MQKPRQHHFFLFTSLLVLSLLLINSYGNTPSTGAAPSIERAANIPPDVRRIISRSCKDCHSAETVWPWYSHIAPISWMIERDVREGRSLLDFSIWAAPDTKGPSADEAEDICRVVKKDIMPPRPYRFMHHDSELSSVDVKTICSWANAVTKNNPGAP